MWNNVKRKLQNNALAPVSPAQPISNSIPKALPNPGSEGLTHLFSQGTKTPLLPESEQQNASKFSGLKRYLKRSII